MKVLSLVSYNIFPAKTGGQKCIALFNQYLSKEVPLTCITVQSNAPEYAESYEVFNILGNTVLRYINLFYFFKINRIIRKKKITHLIIEHPYYGWLGILLKYFSGVQLCVHSHNIESQRFKTLGKWWWLPLYYYEKAIHRFADYNFFITDEDKAFAIQHFSLAIQKCTTITYGCEIANAPSAEDKLNCKKYLQQQHHIDADETILLFNGTLDYPPNLKAVQQILNHINPVLLQHHFKYKIIICGKDLPVEMNELNDYKDKHIIYCGFVDDISIYFKGADIFINPVIEGGGIKTKLVEAIAGNTFSISTQSGSIGVTNTVAGTGIEIVADDDWQTFSNIILNYQAGQHQTADSFYQHFYWGNIAMKVKAFISTLPTNH